MRSTPIERRHYGKPWKALCFGLFIVGSGTVWAQAPATETPAEVHLLNAAKVYFGNDIMPSEEKLFRKAANGLLADFATGAPGVDSPYNAAAWKDDRVIRATRLAWLLVDSQASSQVPPRGVSINGARIEGKLDLEGVKVPFQISISNSFFTDIIELRRASLRLLYLGGSHTKGLIGDGLNVERDLFLCYGFRSEGEVRLGAATIGGSLICNGGAFNNERVLVSPDEVRALNAQYATFACHVDCGYGFTSIGKVDFDGATIKGTADFSGGSFTNKNGNYQAISADSAIFEKYVIFGPGFKSDGCVWLRAARIAGDLDVTGANFSNQNGSALNLIYTKIGTLHFYNEAKINGQILLSSATIETSLCWENLRQPELTSWDLGHAKVNTLAVQQKSWPAHGNLGISGLVFNELAEPAVPLAHTQLSWLKLQRSGRFATQPYDQLAAVFRSMGLQDEAIKVMIAKNLEHGHHTHGFKEFVWYKAFGPFIAFGYHPWNAFYLSVVLILIGWGVFHAGLLANIVTPTSKDAYENPTEHAGNLSEFYPRFNAFIYSLETFVPLLSLGMGKYWRPNANRKEKVGFGPIKFSFNGSWLTVYMWCHVILGWILTTLWFGGLTGLIKP